MCLPTTLLLLLLCSDIQAGEKMGCCFSKELNTTGLPTESSGLLQPPDQSGSSDTAEKLKVHMIAASVAAAAAQQHVCLDEEEEEVPRQTPASLDKRQHIDKDHSKFPSKEVNQIGCQAASTDSQKEEKKEAIIITTSSSSAHTEAGGTHGGPHYYLEVRRKNAELRSSWFQKPPPPLPEQQQQLTIWPGSANLQSSRTEGEKSSVAPGLEDAEELCVVATTLGQGFETRTRSFYSICPIEADDLDHEQTSGASLTTGTAQVSHQAKNDNPAPVLSTVGLVSFELSNEAPPQPESLVSDLLPSSVGQNVSKEFQVISQKHPEREHEQSKDQSPVMSAVAEEGARSVNVVPSKDLYRGDQVNHVDTYFDCLHQARAAFHQAAAHTPAAEKHSAASQPDVDLQSAGQVEVVSTELTSEQEEPLSNTVQSTGNHTDSQQPRVAYQELPENEHSQVSFPYEPKQQYLVIADTQQDQSASSDGPSSYHQCVEADFNSLYKSRESSEPHALQTSKMAFPSSPSLPPSPPPSPASTEPIHSDVDQTTVKELFSLSEGHVEVMAAEKQSSELPPQPDNLLGEPLLLSGGQSDDKEPPMSYEETLVTSQEPLVAFDEPRACEHVQLSLYNSTCTHTESKRQSPVMLQTEETSEEPTLSEGLLRGAKEKLVDHSEESDFDCLHQCEPFAQPAVAQGLQEPSKEHFQVEHSQEGEDASGSLYRSSSFPSDPDSGSAPALLDGDQTSTELCGGQVEPMAAEQSFKPPPHPEDLLKELSPMSGGQMNEQPQGTNQKNSQVTLHWSNDSGCQSHNEERAAEKPDLLSEDRPRRTNEELLAQVLEADLESKPNSQPTEVQMGGPETTLAALTLHDFNPTPSEQELYSSPSGGKVEEVDSSCASKCAEHSITSDTTLTEVSSVYSTSAEWPPTNVSITPDDTINNESAVSFCPPQKADLHPEFTEREHCQTQQLHLHTSDLDTECEGAVDLKNSSSSSQFQGGDSHLEMISEICVQPVAVKHLGQSPQDPPSNHQHQPPPRPCEDPEHSVSPESDGSKKGLAGEPKENQSDVCDVEQKPAKWTENPTTNYSPHTANPSERHLQPICLHPHRDLNRVGSDQVEVDHQTASSCSPLLLDLPDASICPSEEGLVLGCCMKTDLPVMDLCQVDAHASTPSYQIHSACQDPMAAAADEGGIREMVSELLGEEADSSPCHRHPQPWIRLGLEGSGVGWAQGAAQCQDDSGRHSSEGEIDRDPEQIPALVTELQPSMALLGAYPYSTVLPQGACVWEWHTQQPQHVSQPPQCWPITREKKKKNMLMRR